MIAAVEAIASASGLQSPASMQQTNGAGQASSTFADRIENTIASVNADVANADQQIRQLALGQAGSLHGVMLSLEHARLSMGLMVQVRNRLVEAYQDVMRMQI